MWSGCKVFSGERAAVLLTLMLACLSGLFDRKLHIDVISLSGMQGGACSCSAYWCCFWVRLLHFGSVLNHFLATANLLDQLETLVLGRFFQQDLRYVSLPQSLLCLTLGECFALEWHPLFWPPYLEDPEELNIKRPFLNVPVDVTLPETLRRLDCDGDTLEV